MEQKQLDDIKKFASEVIQDVNNANYNYDLQATNITVKEPTVDPKEAKLTGRSFKVRIYGGLKITDRKTGKTKSYSNMHLFDLPVETDLGSFIVHGVEYNAVQELRKLPGVYYRFSAGKPLALFNTGKKSNFKILYDPDTLKFNMYYNGNIPLYPILIYLGYTDSDLRKAWGKDVWQANSNTSITPEEAAKRLYKKMSFGKESNDPAEIKEKILTQFEESSLDKTDTENFLGVKTDHVTPELLVAASKALLDMLDGKIAEHDGNDIYSMKISDYKDYIKEKLSKAGMDARVLTRWLGKVYEGKIGLYGALQKNIDGTFTTFEMSNVFPQTNPIAMLSNKTEVTKLGPGAIGQSEAVTLADSDLRANYAGVLDPAKTPESHKVGVSLYLTRNAKKGPNGEILIKLYNMKTRKVEEVPSYKLAHKAVAFPGELSFTGGKPSAVHKKVHVYIDDEIEDVPLSQVDYAVPNGVDLFNYASLTVPFLNTDQGNRTLMAAKQVAQALPLKYNEAPKVQVDYGEVAPGKTLEQILSDIATNGRELSKWDGKVQSISSKYITIKEKNGQTHKIYIYKDYPLNGDVPFNETPTVVTGEAVKKGQRILKNNFMKDNALAMGTNMKVAYIPYKGLNYEDGVVISETAAKKLTSSHMYIITHKLTDDVTGAKDFTSKKTYQAAYPSKFNLAQLNKLDDSGIVKKGETLEAGDPVILVLRPAQATYEDKIFKVSKKILKNRYVDRSVLWDKDYPGKVTDVSIHNGIIKVTVKTDEPAQVGDKITGRHGNKGIIAKVIPDDAMPADKDGNHPDILLSPLGIVSRINPGQLYETVAGKVADKTGKTIKVKSFAPDRYNEVKKITNKYGIDPDTPMKYPWQKEYKPVLAGTQYIYKLDQSVTHKLSGTSEDVPYSRMSGQPVKDSTHKPQSLDHLTLYSMLGHGASANLQEMATYKSDEANKEYWRALELGNKIPDPQRPVSLNKFIDMLKGAGINVDEYGHTFELQPLTDKEIVKMAPKEVADPTQTLKAKNLEPVKGGLYDIERTGGLRGEQWTRIKLPEKIPNPVFEGAIKMILKDRYGLKQTDFDKILNGQLKIDPKTMRPTEGAGITGTQAFEKLLSFDPKQYEEQLQNEIKHTRKLDSKDVKYRVLKYMKALNRLDYKPTDAYMIQNVPVLPPTLRPVYTSPDGMLMLPDINGLYKDVGVLSKELKDKKELPQEVQHKLTTDLYKSVAAVQGWGDPVTNPGLKGVAKTIVGTAPKRGFFQNKLIDRRQLTSGRSTITPDPKLGIDEIGLPKDMAWEIYRPYILKKLISMGYGATDALKMWKNKDEVAYKAMKDVAAERPVMLNRAPSLHKWSIMAFKPKIVDGKDIKVNQLIVKPFNADFDGDTMSVHVPSTPEAIKEAKGLMPTKNMIKYGENKLFMMPQTEVLLGIYKMSLVKGVKPVGSYSTVDVALNAYRDGKLGLNAYTTIAGKKTSLGNYLLVQALPQKFREYNKVWDAKYVRSLLEKINKEDPGAMAGVLNKIKDLGNEYGTDLMPSIRFKDLKPQTDLSKLLSTPKGAQIVERRMARQKDNSFALFSTRGIRGKPSQARQILAGPGKAVSIRGKTYKNLKTPYSYGMGPTDYYKAMFGARQGAINKSKMTRDPGAFNKELAANYVPMVVTKVQSDDPGVDISTNAPNITSRFLAKDVVYKKKKIAKRGELITPKLALEFKKRRIKKVKVMSPLTDTTPNGMAAKSFGLLPDGKLPDVGTNIGILATHSITEPLSQSTLSAFHTGGIKSGVTPLEQVWGVFRSVHKPDDAVLTYSSGTITKIEKMEKGGYKIYVDDDPYICPSTNKPIVKTGQHVKRGDALTDGVINQKDLMELKGPEPTREYMLNQLKQAIGPSYKDERFLEVLVRGATDKVQITDPGDNLWLDKGDITSGTYIDEVNRTHKAEIPIAYAEGSKLAEPVKDAGLHKGKMLKKEDIEKLKKANVDKVTVKATPIKYKHIIISTAHAPEKDTNWMQAMNFSNLSKVLKSGASYGYITNTDESGPIPRYISGRRLYGK